MAHQFDDAEQQYEAATLGMWVFLATEVLFFGGLFAGYTVYRNWYPQAFAIGSRHLDLWLGTINTGVLLTSSLTMALAVHAAQTNQCRGLLLFLLATILLGTVFLGIKAVEYSHKFHEHLVPGREFGLEHDFLAERKRRAVPDRTRATRAVSEVGNIELFFSFYFVMTGCHALHMVIGVGMLTVLCVGAWQGRFEADYFTPVEVSGLYWHFVDIIWVFLYPLFYLIDLQP